MYTDTVTVFNYHEKTKHWYTTVFHGTHITAEDSANATQQGLTNGDSVDIIIPVVNRKYGQKKYVKPKEFSAAENVQKLFTFSPENDFIVVGDRHTKTPIDEDDYMDGLYSAMNAQYDDVYLIKSVAYFSLLPHFEIGCR